MVLIFEDVWLSVFYVDQMMMVVDYVCCVVNLWVVLGLYVVDMLNVGVFVVLDFFVNIVKMCLWMWGVLSQIMVGYQMYVLEVFDEVCFIRLCVCNVFGSYFFVVIDDQFYQVISYYIVLMFDEGFLIVMYSVGDV